ncbi:MAG: condensation domain-containing protein [Pseudomonadota bacterium]|nr:condensation domain-containing protein [Pseudomonadota bacterium]
MTHPSADGWMPLTLPQIDLWEEYTFHSNEVVSTVAHSLDITGPINEDALKRAIAQVVAESDVLSLEFHDRRPDLPPLQRVNPELRPELVVHDLTGADDPAAEAQRLIEADIGRGIDLKGRGISAQALFRLSPHHLVWYLRTHHAVLDGYGIALIEKRLGELYGHFSAGLPAGDPFHPFESFIDEEETYRASRRFQADREHWVKSLAGAVNFRVLHKGAEDYLSGGAHYGFHELAPETAAQLRRMAGELTMAWPDLLTLLSGLYLRHELPQPETRHRSEAFMIWLPLMSRWGSVGAHMPAMLVNILPVFLTAEPGEGLRRFLARSAGLLKTLRSHGRYRVEQIALDRGVPAGSRFFFSPLINILPFDPPIFPGCDVTRNVQAAGLPEGFALTFRGQEDGTGLTFEMEADTATADTATFERWQRELPEFLAEKLTVEALDGPVGSAIWRGD